MDWRILEKFYPSPLAWDKILISANPCYNSQHILASMIYFLNEEFIIIIINYNIYYNNLYYFVSLHLPFLYNLFIIFFNT